MLLVTDEEHLATVREFAARTGLTDKLNQQLKYLEEYGCWVQESEDAPRRLDATRCVVMLGRDFAPQSFTVVWYFRKQLNEGDLESKHMLTPAEVRETVSFLSEHYRLFMNGGMIFYGSADSGVGAPQFSVSCCPREEAGWEINS